MFISLHIIICMAVLLVLALAAPLCSPFFRKVNEEEEEMDDDLPPISIVLTSHDSATQLSEVLPKLLSQQYSQSYQVVVVIDQSDSDSEDVLKRYSDNPRLYYTTLPVTSRYLSRKKLGLTLGIRAAKYEWVLVTDVHSYPPGDNWLAAMASHCGKDRNMVLGLSLYGDDCGAYMRYENLRTMLYYLRLAQKRRLAYSTNQSVVMIKKSEFFAENGFQGNLEATRAEFELLVNKFAKRDQCAIAIEPEARMIAIKPSPKRWRMRMLCAVHALKMMRGVWRFKSRLYFDLDVMHLYNLLTLAAIAYGLLFEVNVQGMALSIAAAVLWIISQVIRIVIYRPILRYFNNVRPFTAISLDWTISIRDLMMRLRYRFSDKDDFITHKL